MYCTTAAFHFDFVLQDVSTMMQTCETNVASVLARPSKASKGKCRDASWTFMSNFEAATWLCALRRRPINLTRQKWNQHGVNYRREEGKHPTAYQAYWKCKVCATVSTTTRANVRLEMVQIVRRPSAVRPRLVHTQSDQVLKTTPQV